MRRPSTKLIITFLASLIAGFAVSWGIMTVILAAPVRLYGYTNLSVVAVLVAILLVVLLDTPLALHVFDWFRTENETSQVTAGFKPGNSRH